MMKGKERLLEIGEFKFGDIVVVKSWAYRNKSGGTGLMENYHKKIKCRIVKAWHDYECGWRYHAIPLEKLDIPDMTGEKIFISQFEIINVVLR